MPEAGMMRAYTDSRLRRRILSRVGHRGLFLAALGMFDVFFGLFLVLGGQLQYELEISSYIWGWIWIGTGIFIAAGASARHDGIFFGAAVFLKVAWSLEYIRLTFVVDVTNWTRAAYWAMFSAIVIIASAWPESSPAAPEVSRAESVRGEGDEE